MMPRKRSSRSKPLKEPNSRINVLQENKSYNKLQSDQTSAKSRDESVVQPFIGIKSILGDENQPQASSSKTDVDSFATAALYNELDSFRQRWKRELESGNQQDNKTTNDNLDSDKPSAQLNQTETIEKVAKNESNPNEKESSDQVYAEAKKLFLRAVELEKDEMYHESIRYYKQSMHLCPDIERQIYREQCEASTKTNPNNQNQVFADPSKKSENADYDLSAKIDIYKLIAQNFKEDNAKNGYKNCRPNHKHKSGALHISDLPHELLMQILRYVVGDDLALASLESLGLVCRGFYILSKDPSLWRSICYNTWGDDTIPQIENKMKEQIDWRQMYLDRPRVNFDGVYISKTRYIRQGDVGFQDITYRPFHIIRYYRYVRFFPDKRVLILTTNEEPDIVVPIFRHTLNSNQFSAEFSAMEGTYEFVSSNQLEIRAEKRCEKSLLNSIMRNRGRRNQAHLYRQTPISQKFNFKFEVKTSENKPYKNNVLKWMEYTMYTDFDTGQEITSFDISPDTFPNLIFSRVRRLNLKLTQPLTSH